MKGIVSKHLVLTQHKDMRPRVPVPGLILIENEKIERVILLEGEFEFGELEEQFPEYQLEDYSDFYVSPGIIDLNVRHEFETLGDLTASALEGGVTVIALEPGYYSCIDVPSQYFCDIAQIEIVSDSYPFSRIPSTTFALKGYLFPPGPQVKSVAHLENLISQCTRSKIPLFIDATLPDPRMLYMASPLRLDPVEDRKDSEISNCGLFAGAYPENPQASDKSSDESTDELEDLPLPERSASLQSEEIKKINFRSGYGSDEEVEKPEQLINPDSIIAEAKESEESSPLKMRDYLSPKNKDCDISSPYKMRDFTSPRIKDSEENSHLKAKNNKGKHKSHDIYNDLDNRIKASQQKIEDLCLAEKSTYSNSGFTSFGSNSAPKKFSSFHLTIEKVPETDPAEPTSAPLYPNPVKKRELFRPPKLIIKIEAGPDASRDYRCHLANYPDHWEVSGVDKIIEHLTPKTKIHFQNLSSASSLNRIRHIRPQFKNATCEIPAVHLYFTSAAIAVADTRFKNTPPVRNQGNCNLLWDLIKMQGIDCISSQHACIEVDKKKTGNFQQALNGIAAIGCSLQAAWSVLNIPMSSQEQLEHYIVRLAKWLSLYPAGVLGVEKERGSIEEGKFADLIVWKPKEKVRVGEGYRYSATSPFVGCELFGSIKKVYLRGQMAYDGHSYSFGRQLVRN